jgi:hypothetical protein
MKMSAEQIEKVQAWLRRFPSVEICIVCKGKHVVPAEFYTLLSFPAMRPDGVILPPTGMPVVVLVCESCGQLKFHSAITMGMVTADG